MGQITLSCILNNTLLCFGKTDEGFVTFSCWAPVREIHLLHLSWWQINGKSNISSSQQSRNGGNGKTNAKKIFLMAKKFSNSYSIQNKKNTLGIFWVICNHLLLVSRDHPHRFLCKHLLFTSQIIIFQLSRQVWFWMIARKNCFVLANFFYVWLSIC